MTAVMQIEMPLIYRCLLYFSITSMELKNVTNK